MVSALAFWEVRRGFKWAGESKIRREAGREENVLKC
jgi:hypothetical protein